MIKYNFAKRSTTVSKESKRGFLNLKSNENLVKNFFISGKTRHDYQISPDVIHKYPVYDEVFDKVSAHIKTKNFILTAGAHDAIRMLLVSLSRENKVLLAGPNYTGYELYLELFSIPFTLMMRAPTQPHVLGGLLSGAILNDCNVIIITNPDPFSGDFFENNEISSFVHACKNVNISVILDEVYSGLGKSSHVSLIDSYDNLILINSFSKSYGLPGIRVGWIAANENHLERLRNYFPESNLSGYSIDYVSQLLDQPSVIQDYREMVCLNRHTLLKSLELVPGISPYKESATNFLLFRLSKNICAEIMWEKMKEKGIYMAYLGNIQGYENFFRVTVCLPEEQDLLLNELCNI
ncbi:aminotransferase class I/II-fold pyridoxal phosphate-dependent enzyme [Erwinia sp. MYb535]|uniref:aminotransferase class I/II-fold pyridoxal phosphate-dependent enzyme n=1 Tax=Erwinia sp. MYb535 TaxID=2745309 RepID=UPI0030A9C224